MRVGVIDVEAGAVQHLEFIDVGLAGVDGVHGMAIHFRRNMQAVPVGHGGFGKLVVEIDANLLAFLHPDDGTQVAAGQVLQGTRRAMFQRGKVLHDPGIGPLQDGNGVQLRDEIDFHVGLEIGIGAFGWPMALCAHLHGAQPGGGSGRGQETQARGEDETAPRTVDWIVHGISSTRFIYRYERAPSGSPGDPQHNHPAPASLSGTLARFPSGRHGLPSPPDL